MKFYLGLILVLSISFNITNHLYAQGIVKGLVLDSITLEAIPFATVAVYHNNVLITGTDTNYDGAFEIKNLTPISYQFEAKYLGCNTIRKTYEVDSYESLTILFLLQNQVFGEQIILTCGGSQYLPDPPIILFSKTRRKKRKEAKRKRKLERKSH